MPRRLAVRARIAVERITSGAHVSRQHLPLYELDLCIDADASTSP
ncbi:hypothetical protein AGR6A_Lc190209 [Agrobacterium sp. NCPPB 925]|nr:hypothetical protein AGR6A_Lc190209 [Agrobacterium sp. NCPPB 925]